MVYVAMCLTKYQLILTIGRELQMNIYDITIVGAGPGGYTAAIRAAQLGAKIAIVEKGDVGGTCLNRGCIPTKALIESVEALEAAQDMGELGVNIKEAKIDIEAVFKRKDKVVNQLRNGIEYLIKKNKIDLYKGKATFVNPKTIEVMTTDGNTKVVNTDKIILAMGSIPRRIPVSGAHLPNVITSDDALNLSNVPHTMTIIGGGVIGVEMATIFSGMGTNVTILEMMDEILPMMDREMVSILKDAMKNKKVHILTKANVNSIEKSAIGNVVTFTHGNGRQRIDADVVLLSTGRVANTQGIGLEHLGIETERDSVIVNEKLATSLKDVYAIGDVIGGVQLAHVAMAEGIIAAENAMGAEKRVDYKAIPSCVYTNPEIAGVGMTEEQAKEQGYEVVVGRFPIQANGRALTMNQTKGLVKVISEKRFGNILGGFIIGPYATEMISELVLAVNMETTFDELKATVHPHPTISECIYEAVLDIRGECIHKPPNR